jgi:tetratricopeptide (TPR) repeat protein
MNRLSLFGAFCLVATMRIAAAEDLPTDCPRDALASKSPERRLVAVESLSECGTPADVPGLLRALHDGEERIRTAAEQTLWRVWSRSGDASIDGLYRQGMTQLMEGARSRAIATFSTIIERRPDFAEAWNRRAILYLLTGDYTSAQRDLDEALRLNPNHFGVLEGYGDLYIRLSRPERALEYFQKAYEINPNLTGVQRTIDELGRIVDKLHGRGI